MNLVVDLVTFKNLEDCASHILPSVSTLQFFEGKDFAFELPLAWLIFWRLDIVSCYGKERVE